MSCSIDVNVLLYASDRTSERHQAARRLLEECATGPEVLYVAWPVLMSYVRIATHTRVFAVPLAPREALGNVETLLALPRVRAVGELDGFVDAYRAVSGSVVVRGNLVPDAHLAAILLQHGIRTLYSNDSDFKKFPTLEVRNPFA